MTMETLIVDDDINARLITRSILTSADHRVHEAADGQQALERLAAGGIDMIISDILMPVMDGFQLCRTVRTDAALKDIPFIFHTATYTGPEDEAFALKMGADQFLCKPCEPGEFLEAVEGVIKATGNRVAAGGQKPPAADEVEVLTLYNQRLVRKLEQKARELQESNKKLEQDIVERKQAASTLIKAREEAQMYLDIAEVMLVALDEHGNITLINKKGCDILGYDETQLIGKNWFEHIIPEQERENTRAGFMQLLDGEIDSVKHFENGVRTKNGDIRIMHWHNTVIRNPQGAIAGTFSSAMDITDRKQVEKELRASEEKYRDLVENINDVVFSTDAEGVITYISPVVVSLSGYLSEEMVGKHITTFIYNEDVERVAAEFKRLIAGVLRPAEYRIAAKSGKPVWVRSSSRPIFDGEKIVGIQGIIADINEYKKYQKKRKNVEKRLAQAQKMEAIGTLAGGIAHDFNNILSAIIGYTELAIDNVDDGKELLQDLQEVRIAGNRAKELVKQILAFSRQSEQELKPVQVKLIIKEVLKLLRSSLPATIEIRDSIQSDGLIMAGPTQVHQILMNLGTNASHAMQEEGGCLEVDLADIWLDGGFALNHPDIKPGHFLKLTVRDTGQGMSPDLVARIFDPFFTTKKNGKGTGMGLAVVHGIIKSLEGAINVYSEPGKGTEFNIYFPAIERAVKKPRENNAPLPTGTECILFVDDEDSIRNLTKKLLASLGYCVEVRSNGIEALELFKAQPKKYDLVITDMTMPKMAGDYLAEQLLAVRGDVPIILCTGFSAMMDKEKANAIGIREFVLKPIIKRDMAKTIRKVLDENSRRH
jgi:PAS domain S-box-containing protein